MSPTFTNEQPTNQRTTNEQPTALMPNPLEKAFKAFKKGVYADLNIMQIGLLAQLDKIKCDLNRTFLLDSKAAYFNKLATATNSTPYQGRKE